MTHWKTLVDELRGPKTARRMTLKQIAEECDATVSAISEIARGETTEPRYQLGIKLARLRAREARKAA